MRYARCPECHRNRLVVTLRGKRGKGVVFRRHRLPWPQERLHERCQNELCRWTHRPVPDASCLRTVPA